MNDFITSSNILSKEILPSYKQIDCKEHGVNESLSNKCRFCEKAIVAEKEVNRLEHQKNTWWNLSSGKILTAASVEDEFFNVEFKDYIVDNESKANGLLVAKKYAVSNKLTQGLSLIIHGAPGTGKTMLSICIMKTIIKNKYLEDNGYNDKIGDKVKYLKYYELNTKDYPENSQANLMSKKFLIIDEIGMSDSHYKQEKLEQIIDKRWSNKLPTILLTNLNEAKFNEIFSSPAMQSRIRQKYFRITITGDDYREKLKLF